MKVNSGGASIESSKCVFFEALRSQIMKFDIRLNFKVLMR
jgi:hypothetical protein